MRSSIRLSIAGVAVLSLFAGQQPAPAPAEQPAVPSEVTQASGSQVTAAAKPQNSPGLVLNLQNASLTLVIDELAKRLKINYILDPRIKGSVTVNTYGELKEVDARALLELILRMNGAAMIQVGEIYRIVPLAEAARQPLMPQVEPKTIPEDDKLALNLVFLKYANVTELAKLLEKFVGEGATMITYEPANLLLLLDNNRNMRRIMELVGMFDSDVLARQRVRLLEVKYGRPSDIARELDTIMRSISLGDKSSAVKFMPVDRINTIIAVAPNPGVFEEVEKWLKKLDVEVKVTAGTVDNYVYRVKYGQADALAAAITQLYFGGYAGYSGYGMGYGAGFGFGGSSPISGGYTPYGSAGYPGYGYGAAAPAGMPAMSFGYGAYPAGYGGYPRQPFPPYSQGTTPAGTTGAGTTPQGVQRPTDLTGSYLGAGFGLGYGYPAAEGMPRVVPNPLDNTLLIQATPQDYQQILKILRSLDVPPRQVLIEAKIYEVSLTDSFASGVEAYLQKRGGSGNGSPSLATNLLQGSVSPAGLTLTAGALVGRSRELLAFLSAQEDVRRAKVISAPSVIATDSIPASINVGQQVPTLTSQAITGAQLGGSSLFANTIQNQNSGVTLNVLARVNPSGIVTLYINQDVSAPVAPPANAAIQSPSFTKRTVQTQVTVQDGDTIAIGGIIQETDTHSSSGVPLLHRIPVLGGAFGAKSMTKDRTELIVFLTPRVIYDTNQMVEATEELKSNLKRLRNVLKE